VARDALGPQGRHHRRVEGVAAADHDTLLRHEPGDRRQAGAADADEVHVTQPVHRRDVARDLDPHAVTSVKKQQYGVDGVNQP
jgi:hypothetical protein